MYTRSTSYELTNAFGESVVGRDSVAVTIVPWEEETVVLELDRQPQAEAAEHDRGILLGFVTKGGEEGDSNA